MKIDRRIAIPVGVVALLAAVILLSGRSVPGPNGTKLIQNVDEYAAANEKSKQLSLPVFQKADAGDELSADDKKNIEVALKEFESMITFEPRRCGPNFGAGKSYMVLGDFQRASERFEQCVMNELLDPAKDSPELKATVIEAKALAAECLVEVAAQYAASGDKDLMARRTGMYNRAFALSDEAIKAIPNSPKYLLARAQASINLKHIPDAKKDVAAALALDPQNLKAKSLAIMLGIEKIDKTSPVSEN